MDLIELTLNVLIIACGVFVACGFGALACEVIETALVDLEGLDG